jgi:filamentous hemagglutinin family protein
MPRKKKVRHPVKLPRSASAIRASSSPAVAGFKPASAALAIAAAFSSWVPPAWSQPSGAQAVHGTASLSQQGNTLVVTTQNGAGTAHSSINWQSFSVPAGSTTQFNQPSATSTSINRVTGGNVSQIFGTLSSNGKLVLVNPAGIAIGAGAMVDTAGFTASTLRMSDADALAGRMRFGDGSTGGTLNIDGQILARGGDVVLIASDVQVGASALIQSPNGATVLAAGRKVELTGRGLEGIRFEVQAPADQAVNLGTLSGDAVGIFAGTLKHSGLINATAATADGGRVVLKSAGDALVSGQINAVAGGRGGSIDIFGQRVGLQSGAQIDVSGANGGGSIRVGGDFQGKNLAVPNAMRTYVDRGATLRADATGQGDGGRIVVWADDQTQSFGAISARGGAQGGDGGFVEVSGKHKLDFASSVDTRAPLGRTGTLLLDPDDIDVNVSGTPYTGPVMFADAPTSLTLDVATINSATSNVILQANNDLSINAAINIANSGTSFTAQAGRYLTVSNPITTNNGDITLVAGDLGASPVSTESGLYVNAAINSNGGNIDLRSRLSDVGGTSVSINAAVNSGNGTLLVSGQGIQVTSTGTLSKSGTGDLTLLSDMIDLQGDVTSAGRVVVMPETTSHPISLGGVDENGYLNLTAAELNKIIAPVLVIGANNQTGGIEVQGTVAPTNVSAMSLINSSTVGPGISQVAALVVANLNADARTVTLTNSGNQFNQISGRSYAGAFQLTSNTATALTVGTVDGINGINSAGFSTDVANIGGSLNQTQAIVANTLTANATGGLDLSFVTNQIANLGATTNTGAGNLVVKSNVSMTVAGAVNNTGNIFLQSAGSLTTSSLGFVNSSGGTTLNALGGNLDLRASVASGSGAITLQSGGDILFNATGSMGLSGGSATLTTGAGGKVKQLQGITMLNVDLSLADAIVSGGTLQVQKSLTNTGNLIISGSGAIALQNTGALLTNTSTGLIDLQGSGGITASGGTGLMIDNHGLFKKTAGSPSAIAGPQFSFVNNSDGTISVLAGGLDFGADVFTANSGRIKLASGTFVKSAASASPSPSPSFTNAGVIEGSGTMDLSGAKLVNTGTLRPGGAGTVGTFTLVGGLDTSTGTIELDLDTAANYDKIMFSGSVASTAASVYTPTPVAGANYAAGTVFDIIRNTATAGSASGSLTAPAGYAMAFTAAPAGIQLTALAAVPPAPPPPPPAAPPPKAAPAPAPAPASQSQEPDNQVLVFQGLFEKEVEAQKDRDSKKNKDAVLFTEAQCKAS